MKTRNAAALGMALLMAAPLTAIVRKISNEIIVEGNRYSVPAGGHRVIVEALSDDIFHVGASPSMQVLKFRESQSAVMEPGNPRIRTDAMPGEFLISSPTTVVSVNRADGTVTFMSATGDTILSESRPLDNVSEYKSASFIPHKGTWLYGGGERGHSPNINGDSLTFYNRQNYGYTGSDPRISQMGISVPYFASDGGYGVLFDDFSPASLQTGDSIVYTTENQYPLSYYFINGGDNLAGVTSLYTQLTGRQPLPPFWSLGYVTSKYGYHNEREALGAIDSLKQRGYPVDGIVFDLYWYGKETDMGRLAWNREQFPDPKGMLDSLRRMGVNTVLITQPYINKIGAIDNYNILADGGMLAKDSEGNVNDVTTWVGDAGMFDVSNPKTREWLWQRLAPLTAEGVAGWWGDLGEPEVHPLSIVHDNGLTAAEYHNAYGNEWSKLIYDGLRKDFPDMRPMLMMRGGTAGLQRYGVFPWTTDVSRSWGGLEPQVNLMLSSGLSGLAYMSSDLGGFAVDPANPVDPELYVRWVEAGAFTPFMRTHAQYKPEPYHYPEYEGILKDYIRMRYQWLPYNYTLAYENASKGFPLVRPLNFRGDNSDDRYAAVSDEYLWGDNVLVAPVVRKGARSRQVIFPSGTWIDWWNPLMSYKGGTRHTVQAPLGRLPLFVRKGAFIPQYNKNIENVTQYDPSVLTLYYFPSDEVTSYTMFDDDRLSPVSLEEGKYQLSTFSGSYGGGRLEINMTTDGNLYEGMPRYRDITLVVPGVTAAPHEVSLSDGTPLPAVAGKDLTSKTGWIYDAATRTLRVRFPWAYEALTLTAR